MKKIKGVPFSEVFSHCIKNPIVKAAYESECEQPSDDWQIIYYSSDDQEGVIYDSYCIDKHGIKRQ
ncbi:hypothetical protein XBKQ1_270004 [Xenorhabdus bovienii str. kraussei Quebec]|uniref:Uncharacterized protein n=1 Tax=Xenorhabdus bovienii str. kraussei Quebec TaxID=1398203 RepID=A0A077PLI8_XENBV|nr:hypothetical protein [Xenorhabdus bovienii]MDE9447780.1 hypothetical protein [Xenorhabdus bovienii]CDH20619.1 hypothetical protein XBKQ1_270004 [Xenorhabdus bovienii str. kraussei Quebec]